MNDTSRIRIVFAGTPDFSVPALRHLIEAGIAPVAVLTQPDRPAGRGQHLVPGPVKQAAIEAEIPVHQPASLNAKGALNLVSGYKPDLMVVVAYGLLLPAHILHIPRQGCWNIHASLLPRWRGAAPIQRAIEAGDRKSGVCIMQMEAGLDTGPILHCESLVLDENETGGSLHDKLSELGASALMTCMQHLMSGDPLEPRPQPESGVTYARKLEKAEAHIRWEEAAEVLDRRIRAFNPWPVAWCMVGEERTRIWKARVVRNDHDRRPGTVLNADKQGIDIATGDQVLRLLELQRPGKRRMRAADYLNAMSLPERLDGA